MVSTEPCHHNPCFFSMQEVIYGQGHGIKEMARMVALYLSALFGKCEMHNSASCLQPWLVMINGYLLLSCKPDGGNLLYVQKFFIPQTYLF